MTRTRIDRRLLLAVCFGVIALPLALQAQPTARVWRIGAFHVGDHIPPGLEGLRDGLKELGYEEGRSIQLDIRNLSNEEAAIRTAREFVQSQVDLIVAFGNPTARAARVVTTEIPNRDAPRHRP
jgi:putative tryptophan/tyrosine transport system substrate-binding protein